MSEIRMNAADGCAVVVVILQNREQSAIVSFHAAVSENYLWSMNNII